MIVKVDIGEVEGVDLKKELALSGGKIHQLMNDQKGDPLDNLRELALHSLRLIELYRIFEKSDETHES